MKTSIQLLDDIEYFISNFKTYDLNIQNSKLKELEYECDDYFDNHKMNHSIIDKLSYARNQVKNYQISKGIIKPKEEEKMEYSIHRNINKSLDCKGFKY